MKKLCVVFPGRKYSVDRSLLYYPSKLIKDRGYEMIYLHYDQPKESIDEDFNISLNRATNYLDSHAVSTLDFYSYDEVIFLSKSIGTVLSGQLKEKNKDANIHQILLTPIEESLKYIENKDLILCGENDTYLKDAKNKLALFPNSYIFPNFSHSLESKTNYHLTLKTVEDVTGIVEQYINSYKL